MKLGLYLSGAEIKVNVIKEISLAQAGGVSPAKRACVECIFLRSFFTEYIVGSAD